MRRLLPLVLLFAFVAEDARASCAAATVRQTVEAADAAFVGRFESERYDENGTRWLTFRVENLIKGPLGDTVEIPSGSRRRPTPGSFGGFLPGERAGFALYQQDGVWRGDDCVIYDPEELTDGLKPIQRPLGRGRAAYAVTGQFGNATIALLGRRGRPLAYGFERVAGVTVCPGGRRLLGYGVDRVVVLRTRDLRRKRTVAAPGLTRLHCLRDAVVHLTAGGLFRDGRQIWQGPSEAWQFHGRSAYFGRDMSIFAVDLVTGVERPVATLPFERSQNPLQLMAVSPDGRRLAVVVNRWPADNQEQRLTQIALVELATGQVRTADVADGPYQGVGWAGPDRFALPGARSPGMGGPAPRLRFFDTGLRPVGELAGWWPDSLSAGRDGVFGAIANRIERATPAGVTEVGRILGGADVSQVHPLPAIQVRASRRTPRF